jgi:hypothetical protein
MMPKDVYYALLRGEPGTLGNVAAITTAWDLLNSGDLSTETIEAILDYGVKLAKKTSRITLTHEDIIREIARWRANIQQM